MGSSSLDAGLLAGEFPSLFRVVLVVWMATFGGCVGSFLNVVVYRLPRGMSLVHPGSHCPSCQCPIRWYHNIPVFAWITLGGRCHNCSARISVRYPLVEAVSAGLFAAVAWTGPLAVGGGAAGPTPVAVGWWAMAAWWLCGYHLILLSGLLVLALIENDGHPGAGVGFPWRSYVGLALVGWIAPPIWATVAWSSGPLVPADHRLPASVLVAAVVAYARNTLISACGAALLSLAACPATALGPARERGRLFAGGNLLLVGLFLGAEAVFALATATAGVFLAATCLPQFLPRRQTHSVRPTWSLILFALTVSWLVIWRPWFGWQPSCGAWQTVLIGAGLLVACGLLSLGTRAIIR